MIQLKGKRGPLFTKAYNRFLRDPRIKPVDKAVFLCLKSHRDSDDECIPPVDMVADEMGIDRNTVYKSLKRLEGHGLLNRIRRTSGGNMVANQYLFNDEHYVKFKTAPTKTPRREKQTPQLSAKRDTRKIKEEEKPLNVVPIRQVV